MTRYLLAIDQGTTGSTALVMGIDGRTLGRDSFELPQHYPAPAWVEHDPEEIWASVEQAVAGFIVRSSGRIGGRPRNASGCAPPVTRRRWPSARGWSSIRTYRRPRW